MLGLEIFVHSVKMVLRNLKQALQISVVPALVGGLLIVGLTYVFGISFESLENESTGLPAGVTPGAFFGFLFSFLIVVFGIMLWIVVSWHRFVLLEEYPTGLVPVFRADRILAYLGRLLMLGLLGMIVLIPLAFVMGVLVQAVAILGVVLWLVLVVLLTVGFYRLSPILPGAAIGKSVTISDAWQATSGANGSIALLVILSILFQLLLQFIAGVLLFIPVIGPIVVIFAGMLVVPLISVSILTTLYGVFIEKRELS